MNDQFLKFGNPRIEMLSEKKLIGKNLEMSVSENKTEELWKSFMLKKKNIMNNLTGDKISMQVYDPLYFQKFDPSKKFTKWATVEVDSFNDVPVNLETFTLTSGLYAIFEYKGSSSDNRIFQYIFTDWLLNSNYILDDRPHFEILGEKYKKNDPNSEEEIWIPITPKKKPH